MTSRGEIRMKLWCDVFARIQATSSHSTIGDIEDAANIALEMFDHRFPAESSEPVDDPRRAAFMQGYECAVLGKETPEQGFKRFIDEVGPMVRRGDEWK